MNSKVEQSINRPSAGISPKLQMAVVFFVLAITSLLGAFFVSKIVIERLFREEIAHHVQALAKQMQVVLDPRPASTNKEPVENLLIQEEAKDLVRKPSWNFDKLCPERLDGYFYLWDDDVLLAHGGRTVDELMTARDLDDKYETVKQNGRAVYQESIAQLKKAIEQKTYYAEYTWSIPNGCTSSPPKFPILKDKIGYATLVFEQPSPKNSKYRKWWIGTGVYPFPTIVFWTMMTWGPALLSVALGAASFWWLNRTISPQIAEGDRLKQGLRLAREVQTYLFPQSLPIVHGLDYCAKCVPAQDVGGDYYDFVELPERKLGIAIGDVSGKGMPAAIMMANLQACLRGQAASVRKLPGLIGSLNRMIFNASSPNRYATFFYAEYDPQTRQIVYVNAGHNAPFVLRPLGANCDEFFWDKRGRAIGMFLDEKYDEHCFQLQPGDLIVLYTDGVSESLNPQEQEWGEDNLRDCAKTCVGLTACETLDRLILQSKAFAANAPQHDDMTLVVLRVLSPEGGSRS